jgi:sterol desaturase/sphingolipid hydroxylase (fatty acid hydroxylase superfamily)
VLRHDIGSLNLWLKESDWRSHEASLQWTALLLGFIVFAVWETFRPRKALVASAGRRWTRHAILSFLINSPLAWVWPISVVAVAVAVSHSPYGLLNRASLPISLRYILAILLLDLVRYGQHRLYHSIPALWRIHRVHHADPDCDWSTGLLFHPGEVLLTQASYLAVVALLAPPPLAVLGLEIVSILQTFFEHANVALPERIDAVLRRFLITPDLHRTHHSDRMVEQNTNFGTVFSWWDFCFKTYLPAPAAGHQHMGFGLPEVDKRGLSVLNLLALPFRKLPPAEGLAQGMSRTQDPLSGETAVSVFTDR